MGHSHEMSACNPKKSSNYAQKSALIGIPQLKTTSDKDFLKF